MSFKKKYVKLYTLKKSNAYKANIGKSVRFSFKKCYQNLLQLILYIYKNHYDVYNLSVKLAIDVNIFFRF